MFLVALLLLLLLGYCCRTKFDGPPGSISMAVIVEQQPCRELFPLVQPQPVSFCVLVYVLCASVYQVCMIRVRGVFAATSSVYSSSSSNNSSNSSNSSTTSAAFQALAFVPAVTTVYLCAVGAQRGDRTTTSNATIKHHTASDLIHQVYEAYSSSSSSNSSSSSKSGGPHI